MNQRKAKLQRRDRIRKLEALIEEFADHQSNRCGWPKGYEQWKEGHCACGLTEALAEVGLSIEWAGGPPDG